MTGAEMAGEPTPARGGT